jgi:hypothetical protein
MSMATDDQGVRFTAEAVAEAMESIFFGVDVTKVDGAVVEFTRSTDNTVTNGKFRVTVERVAERKPPQPWCPICKTFHPVYTGDR